MTIAMRIWPPNEHPIDSHMLSPRACALDAAYQLETVAASKKSEKFKKLGRVYSLAENQNVK
jgi:hypothetical protein